MQTLCELKVNKKNNKKKIKNNIDIYPSKYPACSILYFQFSGILPMVL